MGGEGGAEIRIGGFVHADGNGMGRRQTAIGTLVERHTRYVMLFPLPDGSTAEAVRNALTETAEAAVSGLLCQNRLNRGLRADRIVLLLLQVKAIRRLFWSHPRCGDNAAI